VEVDSTGKPTDQDTLAARVELDVRGQSTARLPPGLVLVNWTDEPLPATKIDPKLAHYTGQAELGDAVNEGCVAAAHHDEETAEKHFGRAVKLAVESRNQQILDLLAPLLDIVDAAAGKVRLKSNIRPTDVKGLAVGSNMTSRTGEAPVQPAPAGPAVKCPSCGWMNDADAILCEKCGHRFETGRPA
jgi:Ca-activated chloride channel family protein